MADDDSARGARRLLLAGLACVLGIPVFAVLHALIGGALGPVTFYLALFVAPAGAVIALGGALITWLTAGKSEVLRNALWVLVSVAGVGGVFLLTGSMGPSRIERDPAAGFNGGFEVVREGMPVNWYVYREPLEAGDARLLMDEADPKEGKRCVHLVVDRIREEARFEPGLFQVKDARESGTYEIRFWTRSAGASFRLYVNSETAESADPLNPIEEVVAPEGEGWRQLSYRYTVPKGYANVRFEVNVATPGELWLDGVEITAAE